MGFLKRRQGLFAAGAVGLGVIALSVVLILAAASSQVPSLPEVSNSELEATGIVLSNPVQIKPAITQGDAERIAVATSHSPSEATALHAMLANVSTPKTRFVCTCWVVSLKAPLVPALGMKGKGAQNLTPRYYLAFINADTGQFMFSQEASTQTTVAGS